MKNKGFVISLTVFISTSLLMVSCQKPVVKAPEEIFLGDDKAPYELTLQQVATLNLVENGSTGYSWHYLIEDESILQVDFDETKAVNPNDKVVGAPSIHTWKFKPLKAGTTSLKLAYCRQWEAKALEASIDKKITLPRLRLFMALMKASIESRQYTISVK